MCKNVKYARVKTSTNGVCAWVKRVLESPHRRREKGKVESNELVFIYDYGIIIVISVRNVAIINRSVAVMSKGMTQKNTEVVTSKETYT
jgi:hypothetical protein